MSQNFYEVLEVPRSASQGEILDAYFSRLRGAHPEVKVSSDHHVVRDRYEAFMVLSDSAQREKYDHALAGAERCPWCGNPLAAYGLEQHVADHVVKGANDGCTVCGRLPARHFRFRANTGLGVWRRLDRFDGNLCKTCSTGVYRAMQARNLSRGPWSIISIFTTPIDMVRNWVSHRKASSISGPRPHDQEYDRGTGLGNPVLSTGRVWASLFAVSMLVLVVALVLLRDAPPVAVPDAEVSQTTTTLDPNSGWALGTCAEFDLFGRVFPIECGEHFAEVVALVATAAECPENSDFSVSLTEGVACFEET
ncbi:MAG TPA: DnaJ domain-containing protein [Acidimicrobiia bacterium]|nr:DnaJ domain-containing protein [Acidimicrobiia bacterium]